MTDTDREAFEAWWATMNEAPYYEGIQERVALNAWQAATQRQQSRIAELEDAARINRENYEFQRNKADKATATVYQFHYAMKDAGWHPGRTDDNLCDIIRAKGKALAELEAEVQALRKDAERYRWLRRQPYAQWTRIGWNTWKDDPAVFPDRDAYIDAAMNKEGARD